MSNHGITNSGNNDKKFSKNKEKSLKDNLKMIVHVKNWTGLKTKTQVN